MHSTSAIGSRRRGALRPVWHACLLLALLQAPSCAGDGSRALPPVSAGTSRPMLLATAATPLRDAEHADRVARLAAASGFRGARIGCEQAAWARMQPDPNGPIDFSELDALVRAHQGGGLAELLICLDTGLERPAGRGRLGTRGVTPAPTQLEVFTAWVAAVVERYDGDGEDDMPDLARPVRYYEIGLEFASRRTKAIGPYLLLLRRAYMAAHAAHSSVVVTHAALLLATPPGVEAPARLGLLSRDDRALLLDGHAHFDALNLQVVADASALDAHLTELTAALAARGARKPVLLSHLAPSPLIGWGRATTCEASLGDLGIVLAPARPSDRCALAAHFRRLVSDDPGALAWTWRFAAAELVRKSVVAASHDVMGIFAGPVEDVGLWRSRALEASAGVTPWSGLVDARTRGRRPAQAALEQLARAFAGRDQAVRVDMGRSDVRLYALKGRAGTVWVGWSEAQGLVLPGQSPSALEIEFKLGGAGLALTPMASLEARPASRDAAVDADRRARIALTSEPLYLSPVTLPAERGP